MDRYIVNANKDLLENPLSVEANCWLRNQGMMPCCAYLRKLWQKQHYVPLKDFSFLERIKVPNIPDHQSWLSPILSNLRELAYDRSSRSHFVVHPSVRPVTNCLKQSIFIFLGQRAVREHSEHKNQSHTVGAFKYCVLLTTWDRTELCYTEERSLKC